MTRHGMVNEGIRVYIWHGTVHRTQHIPLVEYIIYSQMHLTIFLNGFATQEYLRRYSSRSYSILDSMCLLSAIIAVDLVVGQGLVRPV